ncbi:MAG: metalloregulator ArsR/SmtB family transcription factor [Hyphomicrobiaceae bacterium]|nr:metalloregulator ArsR/SmtB family transcription factor [Hyphomicrobiaceae bacterium]
MMTGRDNAHLADDLEGNGWYSGPMREAATEASKLLKSIGSPHRLMILCLLVESPRTVTELSEAIGARQSLTSQHLTHLRLHGLVTVERRGHFATYSLANAAARDIVDVLHRHFCGAIPETRPALACGTGALP